MLAFAHFGGVPGAAYYDNLKPAVKVLKGRNRHRSRIACCPAQPLWLRLPFCRPGKDGAHEKGGVKVKSRFRCRHPVPVPDVSSLGELNCSIAAGDLLDDVRAGHYRNATLHEASP